MAIPQVSESRWTTETSCAVAPRMTLHAHGEDLLRCEGCEPHTHAMGPRHLRAQKKPAPFPGPECSSDCECLSQCSFGISLQKRIVPDNLFVGIVLLRENRQAVVADSQQIVGADQ